MLDYSDQALRERGAQRSRGLPQRLKIDPDKLANAKVLDCGCGIGETAAAMVDLYGCDMIGLDPEDRHTMSQFAGKFKYFKTGVEGLSSEYDNYFDIVQSYTVLEHIPNPAKALEHIYRVLKPGGRALLIANLWRGASASHSSHAVGDWCHLLMPWDEIERQCREMGARAPMEVNKLSYVEYIHHVNRIGFQWVSPAWFQWNKMSEEFYRKHYSVFQWYPRFELDMDFMIMAVQKSGEPTLTDNNYLWHSGRARIVGAA